MSLNFINTESISLTACAISALNEGVTPTHNPCSYYVSESTVLTYSVGQL